LQGRWHQRAGCWLPARVTQWKHLCIDPPSPGLMMMLPGGMQRGSPGGVQVHPRILKETDGPMLRHGLQGIHGKWIFTPMGARRRPDPERLESRYRRFMEAV